MSTKRTRGRVKAIAPSKSVSGGGFVAEDKIGALAAIALLKGSSPLSQIGGAVTRIDFQVRVDGCHFDDLRLTIQNPGGVRVAGVSVRSKQEVTSKKISDEVKDALWAQFMTLMPTAGRHRPDHLVLVTPPCARTAAKALIDLTAKARGNPGDLAERIRQPRFVSAQARALFTDFARSAPASTVSSCSPTAAEVFEAFYFEEVDIDELMASTLPPLAATACNQLLLNPDQAQATALWQALQVACRDQNLVSGYLDLPRLQALLRGRFVLRGYPFHEPDWAKIDKESKGYLEQVPDHIAGVVLARQPEMDALIRSVSQNKITVLMGASGTGKSSLAKRYYENAVTRGARGMWSRPSGWARPQGGALESVMGLPPLTYSLDELFAGVSNGEALLVVDGAEQCANPDLARHLARLIQHCRLQDPNSPWRVVLVSTSDDWGGVLQRVGSGVPGLDFTPLSLDGLSGAEVAQVTEKVPALVPLAMQPHLKKILRLPKILSLLANFLLSGRQVDGSSLSDEARVARWFWQTHVMTDGAPSARASAMKALAENQATQQQSEISEESFSPETKAVLKELARDGLCTVRNGRIGMQHDLYADWARLEMLISKGDEWPVFAKRNIASPYWHRAVRLFGIWLLGRDTNGASDWGHQVEALGNTGDASKVVADLLLEAPVFSAAPVDNLEKVWPSVTRDSGELLRRMLLRVRFSGSFPFEHMIALVGAEVSMAPEALAAQFRLPYPQYWLPLLLVLHRHKDQALQHASLEVARIGESWLELTPSNFAGRLQAADLVISGAERLFAFITGPNRFADRDTEITIFRAAVRAVADQPARVGLLMKRLSGLVPADGRTQFPEKRWIERSTGFGRGTIGTGIRHELPAPVKGGPWDDPNSSFRDLVLTTNVLTSVFHHDPVLGREIAFACCLDAPDIEDSMYRRDDREPTGVHNSHEFYPPLFTKGPFLALLTINHQVGMELVVELTNYYTDRWVDWASHRRGDDELKVVIDHDGNREEWLGDHRLYYAFRDAVTCNHLVVSALMALEKTMLDRIEKKEDIVPMITYLLENSRSLAIVGLVISIGKMLPRLLLDQLWHLVSTPEILAYEHYQNRHTSAYVDTMMLPLPMLRKMAEEWNALPHRRVSLTEALFQLYPYPQANAKLAELGAKLREKLRDPDKLTVPAAFLEELAAMFDSSNWTVTPQGKGTSWQFALPAPMAEANQQRKSAASDNISLLSTPMTCRELLDKSEPLPVEQLEGWWKALDRVPRQSVVDDDGESTIASRADSECGIVAVLLLLGGDWTASSPDRMARFESIIREHLSSPPPPRRFMLDVTQLDFTWENFCADAVPVFLAKDPASIEWRRAAGQLLGSVHLVTIRQLMRRAAARREALAGTFEQLTRLLVLAAAGRQIVNVTTYEKEKPLDWETWWPKQVEKFVAGELPPIPTDWESIQAVPLSPGARHVTRTWTNIDLAVIVAGLGWMPGLGAAKSSAERDTWISWLSSMLMSVRDSLKRRIADRERSPLPNSDETPALRMVAQRLPDVPVAGQSALWLPLFELGGPAEHYVDDYLHQFLLRGLGEPPASDSFNRTWQSMIAWAEQSPVWGGTGPMPSHEMRKMWWALLGLDAMSDLLGHKENESQVESLKEVFGRWAARDLIDAWSAQRFVRFLRGDAAVSLLPESLVWLDRSINRDPDKRWRHDDFRAHLSEFLLWVWNTHDVLIRRHAPAFEAFSRLLVYLVAEQDQVALALQQRIARG